ncbi:NAD(P)-binding protein [Delitschia confertaspora ATCC 74209]|uniref:NAD(P)-binding protein n=1 Tax=Delitschia confertaspora ATCC 74209 TaxID=1513339 RepID=A0A9P4MU12_9PLEO|nr:NAD(P)-binding protein [Delitschia confertaspora ATCC 74209]
MTSRYASAHTYTQGPGDARPTALRIIQDEKLADKLQDKVALITGCSSGIGIETARALKETGMRIFCAVRNLEKGQQALASILDPGRCELIHLDLNSLSSVRKCAEEIKQKTSQLNILITNAGIMACPEGRTEDGFERQFGTNYLAHFLLFHLLKPLLLSSATLEFGSRVVCVSSESHRQCPGINFENVNLENGEYTPPKAYAQSKLAVVYMANEIERRYGQRNLHGLALHPGGIETGLTRHIPPAFVKAMWAQLPGLKDYMKSPEQGAATQVWAAISTELEGKGGIYLEDCGIAGPCENPKNPLAPGYGEKTFDQEEEGKLWEICLKMVGVEGS